MKCGHEDLFSGFVLLVIVQTVVSMVIPNATHLEAILEKYMDKDEAWWQSKARGKRAISQSDMQLILDLHNKLRGQVYPPASNMEYMVRSHDSPSVTILLNHVPNLHRFIMIQYIYILTAEGLTEIEGQALYLLNSQ